MNTMARTFALSLAAWTLSVAVPGCGDPVAAIPGAEVLGPDASHDGHGSHDDGSGHYPDTDAGLETDASAGQSWEPTATATCAQIQAKLEQGIADMGLPGGAFGVAEASDNTVCAVAAGVGDVDAQTAWTPDSLFRIGSVTKTFTTALILMLVDDGVLTIDDPLETWAPGYFDGVGVTLRHLMSNTSGIVSYNYVGNFQRHNPWTPVELVQWAVSNEPGLRFAPGAEYEYSNTNFVLLGLVIESATGKTYEQNVLERLTGPLGLVNTYVAYSGDKHPLLVESYDAEGRNLAAGYDPSMGWSAGSIVSTPSELARWGATLYDGRLLSAATQSEMLTPVVLGDGSVSDQGLGVFIEIDGEESLYGHTGGIGGYLTYLYYYAPTRTAVAASANVQGVQLRDFSAYGWAIPLDLDSP